VTKQPERPAAKKGMADPLELRFERGRIARFEPSAALEWLETDGLGGWSSSTVSGAHTRRYHGWLVAATQPPVGRRVLVSKLAETVALPGGARIDLDTNAFPGAVHPRGFEALERFERDLFPEFTFRLRSEDASDGDVRRDDRDDDLLLKRTIAGVAGESATVVVYELVNGAGTVELELRPFFAGRDAHELRRAEAGREWRIGSEGPGTFRFDSAAGEPSVTVSAPGASFEAGPDWWRSFEYAIERERGFDFVEDLYAPGSWCAVERAGR